MDLEMELRGFDGAFLSVCEQVLAAQRCYERR